MAPKQSTQPRGGCSSVNVGNSTYSDMPAQWPPRLTIRQRMFEAPPERVRGREKGEGVPELRSLGRRTGCWSGPEFRERGDHRRMFQGVWGAAGGQDVGGCGACRSNNNNSRWRAPDHHGAHFFGSLQRANADAVFASMGEEVSSRNKSAAANRASPRSCIPQSDFFL